MSIAQVLRTITRADGGNGLLDERDACALFGGLLDGGVDELEMGAVLGALAMRVLGASELAGFCRASAPRTTRLHYAPAGRNRAAAPVSIPSYSGTREHPNLMPALALLLARFGVPVLVHGPLEAQGRVAGAAVLRELGVLPCSGVQGAQRTLADAGIAFVPTALLSPAIAQAVALRGRLGIPNCAQLVARLLDPFGGAGVCLVPATGDAERAVLATVLEGLGTSALLFLGAEGEAFADPQQRPAIEHFRAGERRLLFDAESSAAAQAAPGHAQADARATAHWTSQALSGKAPLPPPLSNLLACCLYAAGYSEDLNQAKAIVAVRMHTLAAA